MEEIEYIKKEVKLIDVENFDKSMNDYIGREFHSLNGEKYEQSLKYLKSIKYIKIPILEYDTLIPSADVYDLNDKYLFTTPNLFSEPYKKHFRILEDK